MLRRVIRGLLGLSIIVVLLIVDNWIFTKWLGTTLLKWYVANGALIGILTSIAAMSFSDLNKHAGLISSHPLDYFLSWLNLVGVTCSALGTSIESTAETKTLSLIDVVPSIPFWFALVVILIFWVIVIVPLQYFLYLFCGAPSRLLSNSPRQLISRFSGTRIEIKAISPQASVPPDWWIVDLNQKPLALTNTFVALLVLVVQQLDYPVLSWLGF